MSLEGNQNLQLMIRPLRVGLPPVKPRTPWGKGPTAASRIVQHFLVVLLHLPVNLRYRCVKNHFI